jgi:D-lactate dehydrogenase
MKIGFFEVDEKEIEVYKKDLSEHELVFDEEPLTEKNSDKAKDLEILSTRSYSKLTPDVLKELSELKMITTRTTGYDHIDIDFCTEKNILVANVPDYGAFTVAEHTIALMLAISRNLIPSVDRTRKGDFRLDGLRGFELHGKTLGVVGVGSIGKSVIRIAKCIGMTVVAYTRRRDEKLAADMGFKYVELEDLFAKSDVISLHVPYSKETHHLINKENIRKFKKGSVLINTARGGVVDTEAILIGLDEKILRGAGLDVLEEECMVVDEEELLTEQFLKECNLKTQLLNHVLLQRENVIITPHNAFNSTESRERILDMTVKNITAFVEGRPQNTVTK